MLKRVQHDKAVSLGKYAQPTIALFAQQYYSIMFPPFFQYLFVKKWGLFHKKEQNQRFALQELLMQFLVMSRYTTAISY